MFLSHTPRTRAEGGTTLNRSTISQWGATSSMARSMDDTPRKGTPKESGLYRREGPALVCESMVSPPTAHCISEFRGYRTTSRAHAPKEHREPRAEPFGWRSNRALETHDS